MACMVLEKLPEAPRDRIGWPWKEEGLQLPERLPTGRTWPRISIVTPSYNQAAYIEETIRSVLLQGYPNLEYIIIDGGSTDGAVDIIRKYEPWLAYWSSEPDKGQGHAISKGFEKATGEIFGWLNSDDTYCKGALEEVHRRALTAPNAAFLYGDCDVIDANGCKIDHIKSQAGGPAEFLASSYIPQPSTFFRRTAWERVGGIDATFHYSLDYDLWLRMMLEGLQSLYVPVTLSCFRRHGDSKSTKDLIKFGLELMGVLEKLSQKLKEEGFQREMLKGYEQALWMIASGYMEHKDVVHWDSKESAAVSLLWDRLLQSCPRDFHARSHLWEESLYLMGQYFCLNGDPKKGRENFRRIFENGSKNPKAILGWMMSLAGSGFYRLCTRNWARILGLSRRKLRFALGK